VVQTQEVTPKDDRKKILLINFKIIKEQPYSNYLIHLMKYLSITKLYYLILSNMKTSTILIQAQFHHIAKVVWYASANHIKLNTWNRIILVENGFLMLKTHTFKW
jgi:hypothetical protein